MQVNKRDSITIKCGKNEYIEVLQWSNWEGIDIIVDKKNCTQMISLTHEQFKEIKKVVKYIEGEI